MLNNFIKNIKNLSTNSKINQNNILNVTYKAWCKINSILQQSNNNAMILNISSGGCNGFNYKLTILDSNIYTDYEHYNFLHDSKNNNKLYIEPLSEIYVIGTNIDYMEQDYTKNIYESKFVFTPDKKMATSCGCGVSFALK